MINYDFKTFHNNIKPHCVLTNVAQEGKTTPQI